MTADKRLAVYVLFNVLVLAAAFMYVRQYLDAVPIFNHEGFVERSKNTLFGLSFFTSPRPFTVAVTRPPPLAATCVVLARLACASARRCFI